MSAAVRTIATAAGALRVAPLSPQARLELGELFARVGAFEHQALGEVLALALRDGGLPMYGLRTGYGYFRADQAEIARRYALFGRMCIPAALAAFRGRGFDGAVLACACLLNNALGPVQAGELLFMHARRPLEGNSQGGPAASWEQVCGEHTTEALMALVADVNEAWVKAGISGRTLTDIEPCPADLPQVSWFADVVLVGQRFVLVRTELDAADPLLGALVEAGIDEVEFTPSAFLLDDDAEAVTGADDVPGP